MQHVSPQPCVSFPSLLYFLFSFGFCVLLRIIRHVLWSRKTKQKLTHSSTNFTHSTLGENAKTSSPTEQQKTKHKESRFVFVWNIWAQQESTGRRRHKTKPACSPQANIVYIAVHANPINLHFFFCPFCIKTHTDVHYKKRFSFLQKSSDFLSSAWIVWCVPTRLCVHYLHIQPYKKMYFSCVHVFKKQIHQIGSILLWNISESPLIYSDREAERP